MAPLPPPDPDQADPRNREAEPSPYQQIVVEELAGEFLIVPFFFVPEGRVTEMKRRDNVPYDVWVKNSLIEATPGDVVDYLYIERRLDALNAIYPIMTTRKDNERIHMVGVDPWNSTEFMNNMQRKYSMTLIQVPQTFPWIGEPTKQLARVITAKKVRHGGHPVLRWMADNIMVHSDRNGNIKPDRKASNKKIDGIAATLDAFTVLLRNPVARRSVYETRGVRSV
jgi:phage terminase large subunit-like protein